MFRVVRIALARMTKRERRHYFTLIVIRALTAVLDIVGVLLVGVIGAIAAGTLTTAGSSPTIFGVSLGGLFSPDNLLPLAGITLALFLIKAFLAITVTKRISMFIAGIEQRAARSLVERMLLGGLTKLQRWSPGELTHAVTISMNAAYGRLLAHFTTLVTESFLLLCIAIVLAVVSPLTMVAVVVYFGIIGYLIQVYVGKKQQKAGLALGESTVASSTSLSESIGAFREIFTLGRQEYFVDRFAVHRTEMADTAGVAQYVQNLPRYIVESALLLGAVALIASQSLTNNLAAAAATLAIFLTAGFRIMASLLPLQNAAGSIGQVSAEAVLALSLMEEYEDAPPREAPAEPVEEPESGMRVELNGIQFGYSAESPALTEIVANLPAGKSARTASIASSRCGMIGALGRLKSPTDRKTS